VEGRACIDFVLEHVNVGIVQTVADESTVNLSYPDARMVHQLIQSQRLTILPVQSNPQDTIIDAYTKLGRGERDTLRVALANQQAAIVDYLAFVVIHRFGIRTSLLLDLIVYLTQHHRLSAEIATTMVQSIASRYSVPFVNHTLEKLK
jgi:hypothetical protein